MTGTISAPDHARICAAAWLGVCVVGVVLLWWGCGVVGMILWDLLSPGGGVGGVL